MRLEITEPRSNLLQAGGSENSKHIVPRVWSYRDRSLEKDSRFPVKFSKSDPDNSNRIVAVGSKVIALQVALICSGFSTG